MSISFNCFCLTLEYKMPNAVDLSVSIGVGVFLSPISSSVVRSGIVVFPLWKRAPILAS